MMQFSCNFMHLSERWSLSGSRSTMRRGASSSWGAAATLIRVQGADSCSFSGRCCLPRQCAALMATARVMYGCFVPIVQADLADGCESLSHGRSKAISSVEATSALWAALCNRMPRKASPAMGIFTISCETSGRRPNDLEKKPEEGKRQRKRHAPPRAA